MSNIKLNDDLINDITRWVRENGLKANGGATIASLCRHFGISEMTFGRWMQKKAFADAINSARQYFADNLEHDLVASLAKLAKGYTYVKRKTEYISDKNGNPTIKKQTTEDIEVPPSIGAAIFLLTNVAPERWQNKQLQQTDIQGALSLGVNIKSDGAPRIATSEQDVDAER